MVVLHALGQCAIRTAVTTINPRAHLGFSLAIYLIAERGKRIARSELMRFFWPRKTRSEAAHHLSGALHKLSNKGFPLRRHGPTEVSMLRYAATTDVERLATCSPAEVAAHDLSLLPGYEPRASGSFRDWLDDWVTETHRSLSHTLICAMHKAANERDVRTALALADRLLDVDPDSTHAMLGAPSASLLPPYVAAPGHAPLVLWPTVPPRTWIAEPPPRQAKPAPHLPAAAVQSPELAVITSMLDRARELEPSLVHVSGSAGIGKRVLARDAVATAAERGFVSAAVMLTADDIEEPLTTFVPLVARLRKLPGAAGSAPELVRHLEEIAGPPTQNGFTCCETAARERAVIDLIDAICDEQPLLLVIENAQWMDTTSRRLVHRLASDSARRALAVVLTSHVDTLPDAPHDCGNA